MKLKQAPAAPKVRSTCQNWNRRDAPETEGYNEDIDGQGHVTPFGAAPAASGSEPRGCPTPGACSSVEIIQGLRAELAAKQAQIDRLMIEYCPDEMTDEQTAEWTSHQRAAPAASEDDA